MTSKNTDPQDTWRRATELRVERARFRVTQLQVAMGAGMSRSRYAHYEGGLEPISDEMFARCWSSLQELKPARVPPLARPYRVRR